MKIELMCVSSKKNEFKAKDGSEICYYDVFVVMPDGDIGKITSGNYIGPGETVTLVPAVKDGKVVLKVER